jgi:hypothetical protein
MSTKRNLLTVGSLWVVVMAVGLVCLQGDLALAADQQDAVEEVQIQVTFGTGVDKGTRTLEGQGVEFPATIGNVYCFTNISGADAPTSLTHAWYYKGKTKARVDLPVGAATWRTWSSKRIMAHWVGTWEVKVLDDAGQVLATGNFEIK